MTQDRRPMPAPLKMPKPGLWRRTPPAIFPPMMGLFGLGLGWRAASAHLGVTPAFGDMILGATTLLYLFAITAYLAKPLRRPSVIREELRVLPGRAGLAAASLCLSLLAATLVPVTTGLASVLAVAGFGIHALFVVLMVRTLWTSPPEGRVVTPVFHLTFVGFIIPALSANALGRPDLAQILLWTTLVPATLIWGVSLRQLFTRIPPAPLRPLLAIHLAPASLFATVAAGAGLPNVALGFVVLGGIILVALLVSVRWLTESGFSPLWGAFTFPVAAYAGALLQVSGGVGQMGLAGGVVLIAASLFIPVIAYRVLKAWADNSLAAKTNAAEA
jgi:tellurite resistance protein